MATEREEFEALQVEEFLDIVARGTAELNAALEVGWTPRKLKQMMSDPGFVELVEYAKDAFDGKVESVVGQMALRGNFQAAQWWLLNRQKKRWQDTKTIKIDQTVTHNVALVMTAKEAALAMLQERGPAQLQGFHEHAIEATSSDDQ